VRLVLPGLFPGKRSVLTWFVVAFYLLGKFSVFSLMWWRIIYLINARASPGKTSTALAPYYLPGQNWFAICKNSVCGHKKAFSVFEFQCHPCKNNDFLIEKLTPQI
jgi:hypothetical protein